MAESTLRPKNGPYHAGAANTPADPLPEDTTPEDECVTLPPPDYPEWNPAANCYTEFPFDVNSYGGTICRYGTRWGVGDVDVPIWSLPASANPLNGESWNKFTVWFAADFVADFPFWLGKILKLMNVVDLQIKANKDQFWSWYSGAPNGPGGVYNETPNQGYGIWFRKAIIGPGGFPVSYENMVGGVCGGDWPAALPWLFPVYQWHGVIMSFDFSTGNFYSWCLNMHTQEWKDFSYTCDWTSGYGPGQTIDFHDSSLYPDHVANECMFQCTGLPSYWQSSNPSKMGDQPSGCMAQFGFHNDVMDLNVKANRNKFFCDDGVQDVGRQAENIWGVPVKFFSENSDATRNNGTLDFSNNGQYSYHHPGKSTGLTPQYVEYAQPRGGGVKIGTCVSANNYMQGLHCAFSPENQHNQTYVIIPARGGNIVDTTPNTGFQQQNFVLTHEGIFGDVARYGRSIAWSDAASAITGFYGLYGRSDDSSWFPSGGDTDANWQNNPGPLAKSFAPNSGDDPFQAVWILRPLDTSGYKTQDNCLTCVGKHASAGDGWALIRRGEHHVDAAKIRLVIPTVASFDEYTSADTIDPAKFNVVQFRYDPDASQVGFKVNGNAWEYQALLNKIREPQQGVFLGAAANGTGRANQMVGQMPIFLFYHGLKTDSESDGFWNNGRGVVWDGDTNEIIEVPDVTTYNPQARVINPGPASGGNDNVHYICPTTINSNKVTLVARMRCPIFMGASGHDFSGRVFLHDHLASGSAAQQLQVYMEGTNFTGNVQFRRQRQFIASSSFDDIDDVETVGFINSSTSYGHEFMYSWINVLFSWDGAANKIHFYVWNKIRGWIEAPGGGFWGNNSAGEYLKAGASTIGSQNGFGGSPTEFWLCHYGLNNAYIDWSLAANRDAFFDPVTGRALEIDTVGWSEWGSQPLIWSPDGDMTSHLGSMAPWTYTVEPGIAPVLCNDEYVGT